MFRKLLQPYLSAITLPESFSRRLCLSLKPIRQTKYFQPPKRYIGKECGKLRQLIAEKTDKRMKLMNSLVSGIQVIKMYAWEKSFEKVVNAARASEINDIMRTSYRRAILLGFMVYIQKIALFVTVTCYFLLGIQ